jgi:epoxyqueuosine reductase
MPTSISDSAQLRQQLFERAMAEGFQAIAITAAHLPDETGGRLVQAVANGWYGDMTWMEETMARRRSPDAMWPEAKSAIMLAMSYAPETDPMVRLDDKASGVISVYALNRDYHDIIKGKLKRLAQWLATASDHDVKVFVDTAPVMEKPLAEQAGLGWQGKHTNLVSRQLGSWFFLGSILTTKQFESDAAEEDHCGTCTACLDICPTKAFPQPRTLDARRCISYLTIEHRGHIAEEFRRAMGNRIYGCDDCLAVCPWNKFAAAAGEAKLVARADLVAPSLAHLLGLDDRAFRTLFSGSPVKRIGRIRFIRNCLIAAGNSSDRDLLPIVHQHLRDLSPLIRAMAVWALRRLSDANEFASAAQAHLTETDADVRCEWGFV